MDEKQLAPIKNSTTYLILCIYLFVFLVCISALFWVDSSKIGVVLLFAFSLIFTIYTFQHRSAKVQFLPIAILMIWLLSNVFLFEFGPYIYPVKNKNLLYSYLGCVHLALFMGYIKGTKARILAHVRKDMSNEDVELVSKAPALKDTGKLSKEEFDIDVKGSKVVAQKKKLL